MCDPVTLGIAAALSVGGAAVSGQSASSSANRTAAARNAVLQASLAKQHGYFNDNQKTQSDNLAHYAPGAQETQLADAQAARTGLSVGNMTTSDPNSVPITADANPAVRSEIAKRMLAVHDGAVKRAGLNGAVGGYGDSWLKNGLNTAQADRDIGVTNNYSQGERSILEPMQDAASAAAYKRPSLWGPLLTTAGSIVGSAAGSGKSLSSLWAPSGAAPAFEMASTGRVAGPL